MITITITNVQDVVEKQKGWIVANVVGAFVDLEEKVEEIVIEKLRTALAAEGVSLASVSKNDPNRAKAGFDRLISYQIEALRKRDDATRILPMGTQP